MLPAKLFPSTHSTDCFEEREAIQLLNDRCRDLALRFADVQVEFFDLDGMSFGGRTMNSINNDIPTVSSPLAIQKHPHNVVTPSLPYFSLKRRSSFGKSITDITRKSSFRRKGATTKQVNNVAIEDSPAGITHIRYTAGASLYRSGFSTFESTTGVYEDSDGESDTSSLDVDLEDDVETPRPLSRVRASDSYFDDRPLKIPTVPSVPSPPVSTSPSLDDSLDPDVDPSSIPEPTIPPFSFSPPTSPSPNSTTRPWTTPKRSNHRRNCPISISSSYHRPPGLESHDSSASGTTTTSLCPMSVQIKFSPTLTRDFNVDTEGDGFWRTSCASETMAVMDLDLEGAVQPISRTGRGVVE